VSRVEEYRRGEFLLSTDPARLDARAIHAYLTTFSWAEGIPVELVERTLRNSLCFGLDDGAGQIGLTRMITDRATFAYLCDVYVLPGRQGRGLGAWMIECVMGSPQLQGLRRWMLVTGDAHGLSGVPDSRSPAIPTG
jgi:GNAT superfamily N-acetyltransferase